MNYAAVINIWLYGLCGWSLLCRFFGFNERNLELQQSVIRRHDEKFQISISFSTDNYVYVIGVEMFEGGKSTSPWVFEISSQVLHQKENVSSSFMGYSAYSYSINNPTLSQQVQFGSARNLFGIRQTQYYMINQHIPSLPSLKYIQT